MADTVTTQTLVDGPKKTVMAFTNVSDGTGEAAVTKVDVSTLQGSPTSVQIEYLWYSTQGMAVQLYWDATTDVLAWGMASDESMEMDFRYFGGLVNNAGAGVTGDINLTTVGATAGDSYTIVIGLKKN